jgi:hypothetical protein
VNEFLVAHAAVRVAVEQVFVLVELRARVVGDFWKVHTDELEQAIIRVVAEPDVVIAE